MVDFDTDECSPGYVQVGFELNFKSTIREVYL